MKWWAVPCGKEKNEKKLRKKGGKKATHELTNSLGTKHSI